ncbi:hypothetical protein [Henriciella litoralis]|uniref:hypothetical protein n=1 Tax=Henriciella litoralis TaxID=568102 RepID=UPI0009FFA59E|nr:hypothetical protein [Henriciella litoralis]
MTRTVKLFAVATASLAMSGFAMAQDVSLTSAEQDMVSDACRVGAPLIPVQSDFGYETGEFALPIQSDSGDVNSALILSAQSLRDIPECKAEVDDLIASYETGQNAAIS